MKDPYQCPYCYQRSTGFLFIIFTKGCAVCPTKLVNFIEDEVVLLINKVITPSRSSYLPSA